MNRVLVVDDDERLRKQVYWALKDSYKVFQAEDRTQTHQVIEETPVDLVLLDLHLPPRVNTPEEGMKTLEEVRRAKPEIEIIVITADKKEETCLRAIENGAYDYFSKPFDLAEMRVVLKRALFRQNLEHKIQRLHLQLKERYNFAGMVGKSEPMRQIFEVIGTLAQAGCTVLLRGESGTGKELVARAIHYSSQRAGNPFVPVNCAAIPESLLESELFGYEKGAFTGATTRKLGKFELASGGTIFLDEIADMSLAMQAKMLRVLQEHTFERLGGIRSLKANVRLISATNKNLEKLIQAGSLREDLYYRLNVVCLQLPSLREKKQDIPLLIDHFLEKFNQLNHKKIKKVSSLAVDLLINYDWPGNIRELENVIERAVVLATGNTIFPGHLPSHLDGKKKSMLTLSFTDLSLKQTEKELIEKILQATGWNQSKAANKLGIHRNTLHSRIKKFGISRP